ncbi:MAG: tRNA (adenosine(37)-N6)-threonylcarbamoyltransferase complex transferase subunit TsaD [Rhodospirillaceae bacterium]|jgi:N6-L-threonylcarbamoyladenine synthase|nr:tRNA (adenosine(37)-N6)-threonylcarbamoyltransferase complex transferase subunit TsaD [Rhodospirillaceae bacterium]MBT4670841.1 tRNA (adenosine(37)-N6)-threonylcarbamoyltransferase complex transferase subunit TsaD [Rhodospirillaceae bacterium]MBT4720193.1 tRNA (adenosine(37)-N6)-threonylcarbamoyltransferase complex transferase subunit TsaD [Rhodospirillaceae bacterium]MBT4748142.1 tRNA (adenosine(37)-N6)-threonylcarbamoyltransferase complex transferase subunit TsaD [Rhodospirillaceae bacteriu
MNLLGIETSCDETSAAVISGGNGAAPSILSNVVLSQVDIHQPYEGVVPEIAARAHLSHIDRIVAQAMDEADIDFAALDGIAVAGGPGLIGGVIVGVMTAKAIAAVHKLAFLAVNHLEGHALTVRLTQDLEFPFLLLLVSGGHCQLLAVTGVGAYHRLGTTLDDALGEAFDKTAKMLGLGYPGGPQVELRAKTGDAGRFDLPRPMRGRPGCDFSFSGLKTAVRRRIEKIGAPTDTDIDDICAAFQCAVGDVLADRAGRALDIFERRFGDPSALVVAGGVAANQYLRGQLSNFAAARGLELAAPPPDLCTDNGAMIAWAGLERLRLGLTDGLDFAPRPRWPLDPNAAPAMGAGVKA